MNSLARVLILILNYRTPALTLACLDSLTDTLARFPAARVVLIDNASGDDSLAQFRAARNMHAFCARIELLALPNNVGFAAGNHAALRPALASPEPPAFVWLLNSDTLVHAHALDALLTCMETHPRAGIVGSRLQDQAGMPHRSAFRFPTIVSEWEMTMRWSVMTRLCARWMTAPPPPPEETRTDWVPGASMLIRRAVLEQIGLFDEKFFLYYEDVDFCLRAHKAGWETWYAPASRVQHFSGASSKLHAAPRARTRMPRYWFDARRYFFLKHHGWLYTLGADAAWLLGTGLRRVRSLLERQADDDRSREWRDFLVYWMMRQETRQ
jgi:hypothetical protein